MRPPSQTPCLSWSLFVLCAILFHSGDTFCNFLYFYWLFTPYRAASTSLFMYHKWGYMVNQERPNSFNFLRASLVSWLIPTRAMLKVMFTILTFRVLAFSRLRWRFKKLPLRHFCHICPINISLMLFLMHNLIHKKAETLRERHSSLGKNEQLQTSHKNFKFGHQKRQQSS